MFWQLLLEFAPGEQFEYSNSGYILLGVIIDVVSQSSYEDFLSRNIFEPLEMQDSGCEHNPAILKNRAAGYTIIGGALQNAPHIDASNLYAAAGWYSTAEDLYKFTKALYTGQLTSTQTWERMIAPQVSVPDVVSDDASDNASKDQVYFGYGWYISLSSGRRVVAHDGKIPGFRNYLAHYPDDRVDIIILSNLDTTDVRLMAEGIEEIVFQDGK
jgi:CubicO group peptidase (beta-lactamase class C family)